MEVGLAQSRRGHRAPPAAVLLPVLPLRHCAAEVLPVAGRGCDALLDAEHRQLVPVRFRRIPDRAPASGHLRCLAARQGPVSVRRRVLESHPCDAGPRRPRGHPRERDLRLLGGWLVLIGCILTIWVLYSAIGIAVSTRLRSQREVWPVGNLLFTLLGILSPLYYPISILPPVWGGVARLLPATYAALLVQGALGLGGPANLAVDGGLLVLSTAAGLVAAWRLYEWREREPRRSVSRSSGW